MAIEEINRYVSSLNIAEDLEQKDLNEIGSQICQWFDDDEQSRSDWKERTSEYLKLATQVMEEKTWPWPKAANVKFPLLTTAAMQFGARAYPALVPGPNLVQGLVVGRDEGGMKQESAKRVGRHMSYQLLYEMDGWEEDMDRLCQGLPILGVMFKKTYYDEHKKMNVSDLIHPFDLVIDYYAKSLNTASRVSHVIYRTNNEIKERINRGLFLDVPLGEPRELDGTQTETSNAINGTKQPQISPATPRKLVECHCWWDLDGDEYDEPYIVTVDYESKQVLRIVPRFTSEGIEMAEDQKTIIKIEPVQYFTKFGFIPNPDGGIYDLGFGLLLGGINQSVNTLTNQLIDSGTLNNMQAGFLGRGIRMRTGNSRFVPGEWKPVDFSGDDIKKHIFPLPTKEPSEVLFKLLEALVTSGKELASVAEIFVGKMPGQNTPATTTMATIEQGLKVFTAIYKRLYRALGEEYIKLFKLNKLHIDEKVYFTINEPEGPSAQEVSKLDYSGDLLVKPNADPNIVSAAQRLMKVQAIGPLLQMGTINVQEFTKRFLEASEIENINALMKPNPPQPNPEQQQMQAELAMKAQSHQQDAQFKAMTANMDLKAKELDARIRGHEAQMQERKALMEAAHTQSMANVELTARAREADLSIAQKQAETSQKLQHKEMEHRQKVQQMKEKPKNGGKSQ